MELSHNQFTHLMRRFPKFEMSYETVSQKGNINDYDICLAIPTGKKAFIWNTFHNNIDISYLLDINREKQVSKSTIFSKYNIHPMSHNTIVYGTIVNDEELMHDFFVIEDIYFYNGVSLKNTPFINKLSYIKQYVLSMNSTQHSYTMTLPYIWNFDYSLHNELPYIINDNLASSIGYSTHHLQYRSCKFIVPYINVNINKKTNLILPPPTAITTPYYRTKFTIDFNKPQYKYNTIFQIKADIQFDIYHMFAYGNKRSIVYYGILSIPDYKTSVMMNQIFRNIKENTNIDFIEESDDEDDFQNTSPEKYVDLNKTVYFDCKYHRKFKKWVPIIVAPSNSKIIHINKLVRDYYI